MNYDLRTIIFLLTSFFLPFIFASVVQAQTMSNDNYIMKMQELNAISGISTGEDYKLRSTAGNLSSGILEGTNFKVRMGIENPASTSPFSILLSPSVADFGTLSPTNPIIRTVDLDTNSEAVYGYSVMVFENESLTATSSTNKTFIPDTTCDNGECSTENASEWINALTYGFGYRCDNVTGADCNSSFVKANSYRHFPNITNNDDPQSIMAGVGSKNKAIRISYKINISGTQAQSTYSNVITYIGVPNF